MPACEAKEGVHADSPDLKSPDVPAAVAPPNACGLYRLAAALGSNPNADGLK